MTYQLTLSALNKKGGGMGAASMSYQASTTQWNTAVYFTSPERHSTQSSSQTSEMPILTNEDHGILSSTLKKVSCLFTSEHGMHNDDLPR